MSHTGEIHEPRWIRTTCGLCSVGCGVEVAVDKGELRGIRGAAGHPVNAGRLGPKGLMQWQANRHPARGLKPIVRGDDGRLRPAAWDQALAAIARRIDEAIAVHGPSAVAFYNSGQLLLEEYYTLAKLARAGLGTPNLDANTRLCTATVGESLMASFGADGPPGAYEDFDQADCIVLFGHNAAEQSTVLWMRILAAKDRPDPPRIIAIDPRRTLTAASADLHLASRPGTNLALANGILHLLIANDWVDRAFVDAHTTGFAELAAIVKGYDPDTVQAITGVSSGDLRTAAEWIGTRPRVVTTCLQGVYQSNQATATACAVNSMHLLTGKIGRPGCAPFQFAGQPSSMNTRECGADGSYPAYRNWANPAHMADLAARWNVPTETLGSKPVPASDIIEQCVLGQVEVLVVLGSNPAVSFVDVDRVVPALKHVFLVVMDPYADTETVALADVYLPTALWGEKQGTMTNAERRCNFVQKIVEPPGEARSDFDILVDLAGRLHLTDRDGQPLIGYTTPEQAFEDWKRCSRGTIPDYSGMTYAGLRERGGIQWPCDDARPGGTVRLYETPRFPTDPAGTEVFLKDLATGHERDPHEYARIAPDGRARLLTAPFEPPLQAPDAAFPWVATSGRLAYHWHTRTKTGKIAALEAAAPRVYVALNPADAATLGVGDGEIVRIVSRHGNVLAPAKIGTGVPAGTVFLPFHFGDRGTGAAVNALYPRLADPVSKQPIQKQVAVRIERVDGAVDAWWRQP
jgi:ferredoxin-nitrate reductase